MVVKDKNVWVSEADKAIAQHIVSNEDYSIDINVIKEALNKSLQSHSAPATISDGEFSYKTGFLKSEKTNCLILTNSDKPKDFKKFIFVIKQMEGKYNIVCGWFGESKSDVLRKKIKKGQKKSDKLRNKMDQEANREYGSVIDTVGYGARAAVASKMADHRAKKLNEFIPIENEYYDLIRRSVADIFVNAEE